MNVLARSSAIVLSALTAAACASDPAPATAPNDTDGFPIAASEHPDADVTPSHAAAEQSARDDAPGSDLDHAIADVRAFFPDDSVLIPYVLHSDLFQTGAGLAFAFPNWPHAEATTAGFAIASSNGSLALALVGADWDSGGRRAPCLGGVTATNLRLGVPIHRFRRVTPTGC